MIVFVAVRAILGAIASVEPTALDNALDPNLMSAAERLAEIAAILAAGIIRLKARESARAARDSGDVCLAIPARQSRHARNRRRREKS